MTRIFLFGISGKMGNFIVDLADKDPDFEVVGGFDFKPHPSKPTFSDVNKVDVDFDVIVDFSRAEAWDNIEALARKFNKPVVTASTGFDDATVKKIEALSETNAVLRSGNMSLGVNLMLDLVEKAAKTLCDGFDVEIIEKHHNQKVDAPSGTALMLADSVKKVKKDAKYLYGRAGVSKREKDDITIHAVRGGTIVGEHDVIFAGEDEIITISHTALSRKIFAVGALKAAAFIKDKSHGYFTMKNAL